MVLKRFFLLAPITVLLFILQSVWVNFPVPFAVSFVVAQSSDSRKAEADRLVEQGIKQAKSSQFEAALESFQAALIIYQEIGNLLKVANTLNRLGIAYFSQGKYQKAKEFHEQSLVIAKKIGSREEEAKSLNGLGNALTSRVCKVLWRSLPLALITGYLPPTKFSTRN